MKKRSLLTIAFGGICVAAALSANSFAAEATAFRPPAVPLVVHDPYFSIWSFADKLTDDWPRHWTGRINAMCSMVRIDGKPYRIMGVQPADVPAMRQTAVQVWPTRTVYMFEADGVRSALVFTTPSLPNDLDVLSRPLTYVDWRFRAADGKQHTVSVYYDNSAEAVVNEPSQQVVWSKPKIEGLTVMRVGSKDQPVLQKAGDDLAHRLGITSTWPRRRARASRCASRATRRPERRLPPMAASPRPTTPACRGPPATTGP